MWDVNVITKQHSNINIILPNWILHPIFYVDVITYQCFKLVWLISVGERDSIGVYLAVILNSQCPMLKHRGLEIKMKVNNEIEQKGV